MPKPVPNTFAPLPAIGLIVSLTVFSAPVAAQDAPAETFCLPADRSDRQACVALFLDEDGYEICLSDMEAGTERCFSLYRVPDERRTGPDRGPAMPYGSTTAWPLRI